STSIPTPPCSSHSAGSPVNGSPPPPPPPATGAGDGASAGPPPPPVIGSGTTVVVAVELLLLASLSGRRGSTTAVFATVVPVKPLPSSARTKMLAFAPTPSVPAYVQVIVWPL